MKNFKILLVYLFASTLLVACKSGPFNLLKPTTPHQQYQKRLTDAGLHQTAMGSEWINNAQESLQKAVKISLPYQEKGYFAADQIAAIAFQFQLQRGQKLQINLTKKPAQNFAIYMDVWQQENDELKLLAYADTTGKTIQLDAEKTGNYILRLQPELLGSGEFTLAITTGPSLGYPLNSINRNQIQSIFGDGRDAGTRKHEGIDIFAPFRTPVIAVSAGTVTAVNTNNLGGKVVWFRPDHKNYTLYYAHLDEQKVTDGQSVKQGDTLGLMGNTGNAKTTPPHLHLGIYTNNGAIDPFPFVNPVVLNAPKINAATEAINSTMRTTAKTKLQTADTSITLTAGTIARVTAASENSYRIELPDGAIGYLTAKSLTKTNKSLQTIKIKQPLLLYSKPDTAAAVKGQLQTGDVVEVLGSFGDYQLTLQQNNVTGWVKK